MSDIKNVYGFSRRQGYRCRDIFVRSVLECEELQIRMPETDAEWEEVRRGFENKSTNGLITGCVGALDGFLQEMRCPLKKEVGLNVEGYFSGHYNCYGLNCQAACDAYLRFMFFGVVAPGKTNDNIAIQRVQG